MNFHSKKVIDAFFQPFYNQRIENAKKAGKEIHIVFDVAISTFWFSVIDFYAGIYFVGKQSKKETYGGQNLKLAHKAAFILFIKDFFPEPENELGEFLYVVFRSGLVHQISPKKSGLIWDNKCLKLLWVEIDENNKDEYSNKISILNIHKLEELSFSAYLEFKRQIESNEINDYCQNIFTHLLEIPDGLGDGQAIHKAYSKLNHEIKLSIIK